ncbi:helix-turn-helix transcriptional regulator [Candidatus Saccharibacteria bacterium]|nr:helix-turn-helix transcriptional regulator [Candidatus Saccharibacteria bacterium]
MEINERIKARRLELGLSVDDIAEKLHINRATYYRYESEEIKKFPLDIVLPLAEILHLSPQVLMGWDKEERPPDLVVEIDTIARSMDESQQARLLEYAKMLRDYKGG